MKIISSIDLGTVERPDIFTDAEIEGWKKTNTVRTIMDLAGPYIQIALALTAVALWNHPIVWVIAFFVVGGAQHGIALITHELGHNLIFPGRKRLNSFFGTWLYGGPSALPFRFYVDRHWDHHKYVSTDEDTKKLYKRDYSHWNFVKEILLGLSGYDYAYQVLSVLVRHKKKIDVTEGQKTYIADFLIVILVQLVIMIAYVYFGSIWHYIFLWILPLLTIATLLAKLRSSVEHQPLMNERGEGKYYLGTDLPLYRTVRATWIEQLFLTRINFNYHIEHHLFPMISYQHLPKVHSRLYAHNKFPEPPGYVRVLVELWRSNPEFLNDRDYLLD